MIEYNNQGSIRWDSDSRRETTDADGIHLIFQVADLRNTRDLRTVMLEAVYELQARSEVKDACIELFGCKLARGRVAFEVQLFKIAIRPDLAEKLDIVDNRSEPVTESNDRLGLVRKDSPASRAPKAASQEAVVAYLLQRAIDDAPPVTIATIAADTRASLPTIYKVINGYSHCITRDPEQKTLRMRNVGQADWLQWIQRANRLASVTFVDRSGTPRSAERLVKRLRQLEREDIAIGGLLGALHHLPGLDATAAPQLDILVHGTPRSDLSFIQQIDPGLERHQGRGDQAHVVVHFIDRPASLFKHEQGYVWGALPDCIANLQKAGLTHQVQDAINLIRNKQT